MINLIKPAWAQGSITNELTRLGGGDQPWPYQNLSQFIRNFINLAIAIAGVGSFGLLLYGGIRYIASAGDKVGTQKAREVITASIVGLIIVVGSYTVATTLGTVFGFNPTNITIPEAPRSTGGGGGGSGRDRCQTEPADFCTGEHPNRKPVVDPCSTSWVCNSGPDSDPGDGCLEVPASGCEWVDDPPGADPWDCAGPTGTTSCSGAHGQ